MKTLLIWPIGFCGVSVDMFCVSVKSCHMKCNTYFFGASESCIRSFIELVNHEGVFMAI